MQATDDIEVQIEQGMLQGKSNIQDTSSTALRFNGNFVVCILRHSPLVLVVQIWVDKLCV